MGGIGKGALRLILWVVTAILVIAGALIAYWLVHEWFGYYGNRSVTFYIGGGVAGYMVSTPLWALFRRRFDRGS